MPRKQPSKTQQEKEPVNAQVQQNCFGSTQQKTSSSPHPTCAEEMHFGTEDAALRRDSYTRPILGPQLDEFVKNTRGATG